MTEANLRVAQWVASAAPALLIGSVALQLRHPQKLHHAPSDVDFIVPPTSLDAIVRALEPEGYGFVNWERAVSAPLDLAAMAGRIYIRGIHAALPQLDVVYESSVEWQRAWARSVTVTGVHVAHDRDLATVFAARGNARDLELVRALVPAT